MNRPVDAFDHTGDLLRALPKGVLLTTAWEDKVNTMTIGWAHMGIVWGKPVLIVYVRESRFTKEMLDKSDEFTVNVPVCGCDSKILGVCGSKSGRDMDKIRELGLTLVSSDNVSAPGIKELPLTFECKVIYKQEQDVSAIPQAVIDRFYPDVAPGKKDAHTVYYGEILGAYIAE